MNLSKFSGKENKRYRNTDNQNRKKVHKPTNVSQNEDYFT